MKKLNENILRQLIVETLEEGRKKKSTRKRIKEVDPVPTPDSEAHDPYQDVGHGMEADPGPEGFGMGAGLDTKNIMDAISKALEIAKSENPVVAASAKGMLKDLFKKIESSLPGAEQE